ncbi:MAG TPA: DUF1573 domain-containing protein [Holophaga sp.]|nr:DUF1573 domain-containing protein [Holophaga sp.]
MKTLAALALVIPIVCVAQTPVITFEKTHYDFGKINGDRKVTHRFKVTNTGQAFLNITRLNPSCGCTSTVIGKWSLAPGESTEVEASFDPRGFRGEVHKSIQVISDDPANGSLTLTFEANVVQEIMPSSTTLFFYDLTRSASKKETIRLVSGNGQPVKVKETKAPGAPYLSATPRSEGNDVVLEVELDGRKLPAGKMRGVDSLSVITGSAQQPVLPIGIQWELKASVTAVPDRVGWVEAAGKELRSTVSLRQTDGKPFRILSAKSSSGLVKVEGAGKPEAPQQELQIVLLATARPGTYAESVTLALSDPNQPELTLRVSAILR